MSNLVLITSVINTPNKPLSYSNVRSVFTRKERYEQTKKTIQSIREKIPNYKIMIVECTEFTIEEKEYFERNCDYTLNLWNKKELHPKIFGISKSLGEGTMTIQALKYIIENKYEYDNLFKISGRYFLNSSFKYELFNNNNYIFQTMGNVNNINNICTVLYKITSSFTSTFLKFLEKNEKAMLNCIGYEILFGLMLKNIKYDNVIFLDKLGVTGTITVNEDRHLCYW